MARARNIKPGFFKNEDLAECSAWARLCFAGLWTLADREGRLEDRPKRIKGELFAFDSIEVEPLLAELAKHGFILRYAIQGRGFIQVNEFAKHQSPHFREPKSDLPPPQSLGLTTDSTPPKPEALHASDAQEAAVKPEALTTIPALPSTQSPSPTDSGERIPERGYRKEEKARKRAAPPPNRPEDVGEQVWLDWLQLRKTKRADVTETVLSEARKEAAKAGVTLERFLAIWCARGSQGLEAAWLKPDERANGHAPTARERDAEKRRAELREMTGGILGQPRVETPPQEVLDVTARRLG